MGKRVQRDLHMQEKFEAVPRKLRAYTLCEATTVPAARQLWGKRGERVRRKIRGRQHLESDGTPSLFFICNASPAACRQIDCCPSRPPSLPRWWPGLRTRTTLLHSCLPAGHKLHPAPRRLPVPPCLPATLEGASYGYFLLSEGAKIHHGVRTINITISARNPCFGNRWQQLLINSIVGYDTILTNSLVNSPGHGYLYNFQTKELYDLSYGHEPPEGPTRFGDYFVTKCGVLLMSLFVFFTTTMSVSFTLRETQSRMLRFTVQLQHHARHQLPTFQLIFVHVIESLVFVPIMIGILFFLFEFYDDQLLAFLVLTLVWLCELFTMISVRTSISMQFFPRFFLLYFLVFHIYFFSYAYGFSYLAFSATAAFMQHLILYFWNRFEVPALQRFIRSRAHIHQQTGVQITSSTIYTSTLHIARVNVRNPGTINDGLGAAREADALLVQDESTRNQQEGPPNGIADPATNNALQYQEQNPQQAGNAPAGSSSLNPFGSLLLWLLGGGASDGIVSFFSMFRDVRDHGQDFTDPPRNENDQVA